MHGKSGFCLASMSLAIALGTVPSAAAADEPSPEFVAGLRRTAELRKQRLRGRTSRPPGIIDPYPFPPALIIRQTPQVHDEVRGLLDLLRR